MKRQAGFTLIEALVSGGILLSMMALMLPAVVSSFSTGRELTDRVLVRQRQDRGIRLMSQLLRQAAKPRQADTNLRQIGDAWYDASILGEGVTGPRNTPPFDKQGWPVVSFETPLVFASPQEVYFYMLDRGIKDPQISRLDNPPDGPQAALHVNNPNESTGIVGIRYSAAKVAKMSHDQPVPSELFKGGQNDAELVFKPFIWKGIGRAIGSDLEFEFFYSPYRRPDWQLCHLAPPIGDPEQWGFQIRYFDRVGNPLEIPDRGWSLSSQNVSDEAELQKIAFIELFSALGNRDGEPQPMTTRVALMNAL